VRVTFGAALPLTVAFGAALPEIMKAALVPIVTASVVKIDFIDIINS
jgi:hypothetical protein